MTLPCRYIYHWVQEVAPEFMPGLPPSNCWGFLHRHQKSNQWNNCYHNHFIYTCLGWTLSKNRITGDPITLILYQRSDYSFYTVLWTVFCRGILNTMYLARSLPYILAIDSWWHSGFTLPRYFCPCFSKFLAYVWSYKIQRTFHLDYGSEIRRWDGCGHP